MKQSKHAAENITRKNWHLYEIELKDLIRKAEAKKVTLNLSGKKSKSYDEYVKGLKFLINDLYKFHKIDHVKAGGIIIESKKNTPFYSSFLAYKLMHNDICETEAFLKYHYDKYSFATKMEFINFLKYQVKDMIAGVTVFDNKELLDRIMKWAVAKEEILTKAPKPKFLDLQFVLNPDNTYSSSFIKKLSANLKAGEYIERKTYFFDVFKESKRIVWKGSLPHLVYLLQVLSSNEKNYITTSKGKFRIWAATLKYFEIYESSEKYISNKVLADLSHNIRGRYKKKHSQMRSEVDAMLVSVENKLKI